MPGWMSYKLESRLPREISTTSEKSKDELKNLLMRVKRIALKLNIKKQNKQTKN